MMMLKFIAGILLLCSLFNIVAGQDDNFRSHPDLGEYFTRIYKLDQNLVNGMKYYNLHPLAIGNPFLISDKPSEGWVVLNGVEYRDLLLKYDICNQQLILEYTFSHGGMNHVVLNNAFISEFEIFGKHFRKYHFLQTREKFFQVITSGNFTLLKAFKKELVAPGSYSKIAYEYSGEQKKMYLLADSLPVTLKGNSSFIKLFPGHEAEIRKYMKQNKLRLKTADDMALNKLLGYCSLFSEKMLTDSLK
ncbi:MAG: hypothetical protein R6W78_00775 [Bacteroidales bacterium]